MKYAIIQISGKQFLVKPGKWFNIDYLKSGQIGDIIILNKILLLRKENKVRIGKPIIKNYNIYAEIIKQIESKKIKILKTKEKKNYTRTKGHKQMFTRILVSKI